MFDEMKAKGSKLPKIVETLKKNGWYNYQHHDNWRHKDFGDKDFDTNEAYLQLNF